MTEKEIKKQEMPTPMSLDDLLEIVWRRRFYIIIPFILVISITLILCFTLPKIYKATTTIIVSPQIISRDYLNSPLSTNPIEYMNVLEEDIKSRTFLEKIIKELGLYREAIETVPMEKIVERMRKSIELTINQPSRQSREGMTSFSISYLGRGPENVMLVANRIVSLYTEDHLKTRSEQAEKTSSFLASELVRTKSMLEGHEQVLTEFNKRHQQSLPSQRDSNLRILENLITQSQEITEELNDAKNRKILLQQQLVQSEAIPFYTGEDDTNSTFISPLQIRFNQLKEELINLQSKYTDEHPMVVDVKIEMEELQNSMTKGDPEKTTNTFANPLSQQINQQLLAANLEIANFIREDKKIAHMIKDYQTRIEQSPQIEQQLASLTEEYENTKSSYESLLQKKLEAEQSENLGKKYEEEQFRVLDPARIPEIPFKPNKIRILLTGFILALVSGLGLCFLAEIIDSSFHRVRDVESLLDLPVLMSIPTMEIPAEH